MAELDTYKSKRDFEHTPEPAGEEIRPDDGRATFVIHKHAARALHYDLRLEIDGVLASWAVPKGPSLDTHDKRLAVHVEDHPIEYGAFEGVIPQGEYGGGTVMVWDRGWWEPLTQTPVAVMLEKGNLKFRLHGDKLDAGFALVRMKPREGEKRENWLLIKERDDAVRPRDEYDVLEARPESAASGRTMEQIAAEVEPGDDGPAPQPTEIATPADDDVPLAASEHVVRSEMPADTPMQLARLVKRPPEGDDWIHEIKYDGYRIRCAIEEGRVRLLTRNGADWSDRFPELARAAGDLPVKSALLDGEVVVFGSSGLPDFGSLQAAIAKKKTGPVVYMCFDLLYLDGWDVREAPLRKRKELLRALTDSAPSGSEIRYTDHVEGDGAHFHREACTLALEGSVSKRAGRPYTPGRTPDWQKVKCLSRQEFVIGGFTEGRGSRSGFGALLLGTYDGDDLRYAGRVGTGFTADDLASIRARLDAIATSAPPFADPPGISDRTIHWVEPKLIAEVSFQEWTQDNVIRHPSFHGLRADIEATEVTREPPAAGAPETPSPPGASATSAGPDASSPNAGAVSVAGVRITNPGKVLYPSAGTPEDGITKQTLAEYYASIAPAMLRFVSGRPLTLVRCPHGSSRDCFYQKHPDKKSFPKSLETFEIREKSGIQKYFFSKDAKGLISLAQLGALEIHMWNSVAADPERPDQLVFDLDPGPDVGWDQVVSSAVLVRDALAALGLSSFVKTTGGKGLHVVVPLVASARYDEARTLARAFVDRIAAHDPGGFTSKMAKSARKGRIFIDYLRNAHGATAVAPYSTRARPEAPVSVPVTWDELEQGIDPSTLDIISVPGRVAALDAGGSDPWAGFESSRHELSPALFAALGVPWQDEMDA